MGQAQGDQALQEARAERDDALGLSEGLSLDLTDATQRVEQLLKKFTEQQAGVLELHCKMNKQGFELRRECNGLKFKVKNKDELIDKLGEQLKGAHLDAAKVESTHAEDLSGYEKVYTGFKKLNRDNKVQRIELEKLASELRELSTANAQLKDREADYNELEAADDQLKLNYKRRGHVIKELRADLSKCCRHCPQPSEDESSGGEGGDGDDGDDEASGEGSA